MTETKYFPSYSFIAHYSLKLKQIEMSSFLKDFPELHDFVLRHEKEHAELFLRRGYKGVLGQAWIDLRDHKRIMQNNVLWKDYKQFRGNMRGSKKDVLFIIAYNLLIGFGSILLIPYQIWRIIKDVIKK